jgi:polysaccharide biosynthesis/export protein
MPSLTVLPIVNRNAPARRKAWLGLLASAVLLSGCGASSLTDTPGGMTLGEAGDPVRTASVTAVAPATSGIINGQTGALATTPGKTAAKAASAGGTTPTIGAPNKIVETLTASATPGSNAYKVGPLDVLEISVFKAPELSKSVQVAESGTINLPLVEEIQATGRTAQEIERDIAARLGAKYLQKPQVTVYVKEYNSQRVTIEGSIKKPGVYPMRGGNTLLQYIAMAEGLDDKSDSTVVVFRSKEGKRTGAKFDISEIRAGNAQDPVLQSGDMVVAGSSAMKEALGNVLKMMPLVSVFGLL